MGVLNPFKEYAIDLNLLEINILLKLIQRGMPEGAKEEILVMGLYAKFKRKQEEIENSV